MFKHALAAGTLVASSLIGALTMSAQPAGASAITQEAASVSALPSAGRNFIDPFNPYGFGRVHFHPFGFQQFHVPFGFQHFHQVPIGFF
jgi:hypothetical protein